ncbi:hypothetical protein I552_3842 [Mycobacterium xenopi 3993]|nr:hypothetical protein I552_3842 [Mycobacterium xenopi 3993]
MPSSSAQRHSLIGPTRCSTARDSLAPHPKPNNNGSTRRNYPQTPDREPSQGRPDNHSQVVALRRRRRPVLRAELRRSSDVAIS